MTNPRPEKRPICNVKDCKNVVKIHSYREDGSPLYRKVCTSHHNEKYNIAKGIIKKKYGETLWMDRSQCLLCGWNKGPCDRHRIRYGFNGGEYTLGNVMAVCPNCHRLLHLGLLKIK